MNHTRTILSLAALIVLAVSPIGAQNKFAANLDLKRVYLHTADEGVAGYVQVYPTFTNVFPSTVITCPGGGTCTVVVQVSVEAVDLDPEETVFGRVRIGNRSMDPDKLVLMIKGPPAGAEVTRGTGTFMWMLQGVAAGTHTVDAQMMTVGGPVPHTAIANRTLRIDVLKP